MTAGGWVEHHTTMNSRTVYEVRQHNVHLQYLLPRELHLLSKITEHHGEVSVRRTQLTPAQFIAHFGRQ